MPTQPANNRLAELLDGVRQEFDAQAGRATEYEQQRKSSVPHLGPTGDSACVLSFRIIWQTPPSSDPTNEQIHHPVTAQMHEMELVHRRIYELEQQQLQIKAKYVQRHLSAPLDLRETLTMT